MASVCELVHKETGKTRKVYTVDAREILEFPDCPWRLSGRTWRSGTATPSEPSHKRQAEQAARLNAQNSVTQQIAEGVAKALLSHFKNAPPDEDEPHSALAPVDPETDAESDPLE